MAGAPPVIDGRGFLGPGAAAAAVPPEVAAAVAAAASSHGFFQLVNHGADGALLSRMQAAMRAFFDLPLDDKLEVGVGRKRCAGGAGAAGVAGTDWYGASITPWGGPHPASDSRLSLPVLTFRCGAVQRTLWGLLTTS